MMKIYIVQIDMSCDYDGTQWENADLAFKTKEQADTDIEFKVKEYGIDRKGLRIVDLELV
jgi:hypothetical protein